MDKWSEESFILGPTVSGSHARSSLLREKTPPM